MRINPQKNIHFSDKVGVGGSSPLISTKTSDESQIFFNKFLAKKIHFRSKKIIKKNIALAMFGRDEWRELQFIMSPNLYIVILHDIR